MKIVRIYHNNILKGRTVFIGTKKYIINFGFNNSYDLFLNGTFLLTKKSYKEILNYLKTL